MLFGSETALGIVTTAELVAGGASTKQIRSLVGNGILERLARGVYRVVGSRRDWRQQLVAGLRVHPAGVASHLTAAGLHDLGPKPPFRPMLTLPASGASRDTLARVFRSPLDCDDVTSVEQRPTTSLERTIVDLASVLSDDRLTNVVDDAVTARRTDPARITEALARAEFTPSRVGSARLRRVLEPWSTGLLPDSPAEARLLRRLVDFGVTGVVTQHEVRDRAGHFIGRLDLAVPDARCGLDYDSDRWHGPRRWQSDDARIAALRAAGWFVRQPGAGDLLPSNIGWIEAFAAEVARRRRRAA